MMMRHEGSLGRASDTSFLVPIHPPCSAYGHHRLGLGYTIAIEPISPWHPFHCQSRMDDDDLANVLRSSGNTGLPSFYSPANNAGPAAEDPFANPFANPFASGSTQPTELGDTGQSSSSIDGSQREESPYVAQLQREGVINPPVDAGVSAGGFAAEPYNFDSM